MVPNIFGSIGGAEKTGWSTHYQDTYMPALVWAALLGYCTLFRKVLVRSRPWVVYAGTATLIAFLSLIDPYTGTFAVSNIENTFEFWFPREAQSYFIPGPLQAAAIGPQLRNVVPEGSIVTTIEQGMPFLYHNRTIEFFPVAVDTADFAVVVLAATVQGQNSYVGAVDFLGADETKRVDQALMQRMRRDGYDLEHPILVVPGGIAVLQRRH
jgi:hypothetical protein